MTLDLCKLMLVSFENVLQGETEVAIELGNEVVEVFLFMVCSVWPSFCNEGFRLFSMGDLMVFLLKYLDTYCMEFAYCILI